MKISGALLVVLLNFSSCNGPETKKLSMEKVGFVKIPISGNTSSRSSRTHLVSLDSGEYLARHSRISQSIQLYHLDEERLAYELFLAKDGPNPINFYYGFSFISPDSIYISSVPPEIIMVNHTGEVKSRFKVNSPDLKLTSLSAFNGTPLIKHENILYGAQPLFMGHHTIDVSEFKDHYHIFKYHILADTIEWLPIHFREEHWSRGKKMDNFSYLIKGDSIIVSPHHDHDLWIYRLNSGELIDYKETKSAYVKDFLYLNSMPTGHMEGPELVLSHPQYENFLYDRFRNIYYRFYYLPYHFSKGEALMDLQNDRPLIGIMVLNDQLEIIGEYHFDKFEIEAGNYFVGKHGLYLSNNNLNHADFSDDFLNYSIVRFNYE
ncbi:hypothetical protein EL17_13975 [Anditalea andensis]|uniref:DUF4221 domain-containing protein n=2 Tax=Anditalea andensis TaxID=1048983 RepID=A0A074KTY8_9BACT|nr:hypothetical protein EL17_13975 [Anditalea andensis]